MSFLESLRMRNIFPRHGEAPLGMPSDTGSSRMGFGEIMPVIRSLERERNNKVWSDRATEETLNPQPRVDPLKTIRDSVVGKRPENVVLGNQMNPYQEASLGLRQRQIEQQGELGRGRLENQAADRGIRQQRANVYEFKAQNPGLKIQATRGGNYVAINPLTGETKDLGIPTGTLSREEELELMGDNQMEAINARIGGQREIANINNNARLQQIGATIQGQREIAGMRQNRPLLPSQEGQAHQLRANQLMNTNPKIRENKWIKIGADGSVTVAPPATSKQGWLGPYMSSGPSQTEWEEIMTAIYGPNHSQRTGPIQTGPTQTPPPTTNPNQDPAARAAELIKKYGGG